MANARISRGKVSLTVRYAELAADDAKKKITIQEIVCVVLVSQPCSNIYPLMVSKTPDMPYVKAIILRRPRTSKSLPSMIGPRKLPAERQHIPADVIPRHT